MLCTFSFVDHVIFSHNWPNTQIQAIGELFTVAHQAVSGGREPKSDILELLCYDSVLLNYIGRSE